jgi:hypothetical protein
VVAVVKPGTQLRLTVEAAVGLVVLAALLSKVLAFPILK